MTREELKTTVHELRSPLNGVIGFADLIRSGTVTPEQMIEYAGLIHQAGHHMLAVIESHLQGRNQDEFDAGQAVIQVVEMMRHQAEQKGLSITAITQPDQVFIVGNETAFKQVLINLITNSIKYTEAGQIEVSVCPAIPGHREEFGDHVQVAVSDTGIGMDEAGLEQAMTRYGRVEGEHQTGKQSTGIGLPFVRDTVEEAFGGHFKIESQPGEGTLVYLHFPVDK